MLIAIVAFLVGLAILVWSANVFIDGATDLAVSLKLPSFLIGVVIIGAGTSAPEFVVAILSALSGTPSLAVGSAFGSNIANIALILGATALVAPIVVRRGIVRFDMLMLLIATALPMILLFDGSLSKMDAWILLAGLIAIMGVQIIGSLNAPQPKENISHEKKSIVKPLLMLLGGLFLLVISSRAIVWGAVKLSTLWGMSEFIIGLTIVSIGTSLPELVSSIVAARRGETDMVIGNIIGSNTFNMLGVMGVAAVIAPFSIEPSEIIRDMWVLGIATGLLFVLSVWVVVKKPQSAYLHKGSGILFLSVYIGYLWILLQGESF
ncbi:calcium/sodium antiporter [Moraxella sp. PS-22]|uniref:Calcium/sodium antiporter n=1 Tax=Moraxella tetraodonis TaxID=2767221 RepID=A0A9X1UV31_9GAMM|nr:calcium/sodium antiporter [Moraxella tetraodonis]MCG8148799.1 calcium/sodium antiporter [Moraxella tetraodonis]